MCERIFIDLFICEYFKTISNDSTSWYVCLLLKWLNSIMPSTRLNQLRVDATNISTDKQIYYIRSNKIYHITYHNKSPIHYMLIIISFCVCSSYCVSVYNSVCFWLMCTFHPKTLWLTCSLNTRHKMIRCDDQPFQFEMPVKYRTKHKTGPVDTVSEKNPKGTGIQIAAFRNTILQIQYLISMTMLIKVSLRATLTVIRYTMARWQTICDI